MTLANWVREPGWRPALLWTVARPLRTIAAARWLPTGNGLAGRLVERVAWGAAQAAQHVAWRTVRPGTDIAALTPAGGRIVFASDTLIARAIWMFGVFEHAELAAAGNLAKSGTCAIDVGANVGLFTVDISRAVGPNGSVIAVEPVGSTVEQLRANLDRNGCANVSVVVGAAGAEAGEIDLLLTDDPALHSAGGIPMAGHAVIETTTVHSFTLDELWASAGKPMVSLVKIDVEGAETGVLLGAATMIAACRPAIIIEVVGQERLDEVIGLLPGYRAEKAPGFERWNHLLTSR